MRAIPLGEANDASRFGGKAASLAAALAAGFRVPPGFALGVDEVAAILRDESALVELSEEGPWAVRSSAIGEDSDDASFAGQHVTRLNVASANLRRAIAEVAASAHEAAALAYRKRLGIASPPRMAIVIQSMVAAEVSGVLFTRHPVTHAKERVVESAWGLGEAVVAGLVTPDAFRIDTEGRVIERRAGHKDIALVAIAGGGVEQRTETPERAARLSLDDARLARLHALATDVERAFAGDHDIEWAFDARDLFLLQRRNITR